MDNNCGQAQIDPIYQDPQPANILDYRAAFFVPEKNFCGLRIDTLLFNIGVIWPMTLVLYLLLYTEALRKLPFPTLTVLPAGNLKSGRSPLTKNSPERPLTN